MRFKTNFLKNQSGGSMVEYAIVAPIFFLIFFGIFEIATIFFVQSSMESAIFEASRFGRTGDSVQGASREQTARAILNNMTYNMLDSSRLHVRITPLADFSSVDGSAVTEDSINFGAPEEPMLYMITYDWQMFTPMVARALGFSNQIPLSACTVITNEPA